MLIFSWKYLERTRAKADVSASPRILGVLELRVEQEYILGFAKSVLAVSRVRTRGALEQPI